MKPNVPTLDVLQRIADEAGLEQLDDGPVRVDEYSRWAHARFRALWLAGWEAAREACAVVCEARKDKHADQFDHTPAGDDLTRVGLKERAWEAQCCADAIRARGEGQSHETR